MTRTMFRALFLFVLGLGTLTAGAHKDYEVCAGNCEQRLEGVSHHSLEDTICYETTAPPLRTQPSTAEPVAKVSVWYVEPIMVNLANRKLYDPRIEKLRAFFVRHHAPVAKYTELFLQVADENGLDWRLLPTFAFIETGGGRVNMHNNIFGWASGKVHFPSIEEAIRRVGYSLAQDPYKNKTTIQKIHVYNWYHRYQVLASKVLREF